MHHLYPSLKGDQLCPLGFHPQTRYPTRCKRCFRNYKEHGGRRDIDDVAASSPNLSIAQNPRPSSRTWTSTQNLSTVNGGNNQDIELRKRPLSWASTPDIDQQNAQKQNNELYSRAVEDHNVNVTLKLPTAPRRHTTTLDIKEVENSLTKIHNTSASTSKSTNIPDELIILSTDSLAERVRKMNLLKKQRSLNSRESSRERSISKKDSDSETESKPLSIRLDQSKSEALPSDPKRLSLPPKKAVSHSSSNSISASTSISRPVSVPTSIKTISEFTSSSDVIKPSPKVKNTSTLPTIIQKTVSAGDVQIETNITSKDTKRHQTHEFHRPTNNGSAIKPQDDNLQDDMKNLRSQLETMKIRAERAEREKSDILLRRLASMDTASNRTAASEALMLQQKVNELKEQLEHVNDDKRKLNSRMKEIEHKSSENELKRKLQAAEQICEELMEENQASKKEILNLQAEMDELQDTFRDDEMKAKTNLQKDFEKATKNCRILSFKLKKSERKIDTMEQEKQSRLNDDLMVKIKKLEEELRISNELTRKLQTETGELRNPGNKKAPMLGVIGKSTSADGKITRESLTRGGSQEDSQQLQRELQDSIERETDLKDQLKFAEEEADNLRKKVARFEDENDSLMMQLKKMATRSRTRKFSPTPHHNAPEMLADRDEGISDEDDPTELRILLELNEQEASILRKRVEGLERENNETKKQLKEMQIKLRQESVNSNNRHGSFLSSLNGSDKKLKTLNDELTQLRKVIIRLENENEKLSKENKQSQLLRSNENNSAEKSDVIKLKESLSETQRERDELNLKLKRMQLDADGGLPPRNPKSVSDLTPKNHLKKWIQELEDEISEMRALVVNSGAEKLKSLESEKTSLKEDLKKYKQKLSLAEGDIQKLKLLNNSTLKVNDLEKKLKKSDDESKKLSLEVKSLEEKIKNQELTIQQINTVKSSLETQTKREKEKFLILKKEYDKEREQMNSKIIQFDQQLKSANTTAEKTKANLEKEINDLQLKSTKSESKQVQDIKKLLNDTQKTLTDEKKRYAELNTHWETLSEETILMRAQLTTEKQNLKIELNSVNQKLSEMEVIRKDRTDIAKKLNDANKKILDLETKTNKSGSSYEHERSMLKSKLMEKEHEYERLRRENEMNVDLVFQLRKDNEDINSKLNDFNRIEQAQSSLNGHSARMESEIKELKLQLQSSELQLKSEVASTRLRYEQQVKNLGSELTSMQRQCERFKKDRDVFKQMLESAQKKIGDLKANSTTGRQSRGSMHSSDDDDKSKIAYLEQQIGCLEDQLVEARLDVGKVKTELISERSANEIKISEMQSKLNEFEEERVIGSGRTKIPGMKTKLELSWQKEREDQQRLLQETSTLARDLRQTLFEVERERDKERLESKRKQDQIKRSTEEEMEEGRKKIAELQCDLLELRDVHAKLRTSNEKLRRERERYEKELIKRRIEQDGGESKVGALLQTVDELVKIAPDLKIVTAPKQSRYTSENTLRPEQNVSQRSRSPSPALSNTQIASVLARLSETSEELRKFQRMNEDEKERTRIRRSNLRRAASQENDPHGSKNSVASTSQRNGSQPSRNGSTIRKSLSLDHSIQKEQNIWQHEDGSVTSIQSIDSELGGLVRDSSFDSRLDSRLSGGSTQSDIPRGPRKKKKGLMGKLRNLTKSSRNSESELSIQGSDSDISVASDMRSSKRDLRGRLSGMFKRSGSNSRSNSTEHVGSDHRPVAVTVVGEPDGPQPREPPPANSLTPKPIRSISKPPTAAPTTPMTKRRLAK